MTEAYPFISGAVMMGQFVAAAFFFRFWKRTRDPFFSVFGAAFTIFGVGQIVLVLDHGQYAEQDPPVYLVRLVGFLVILAGIALKNRRKESS